MEYRRSPESPNRKLKKIELPKEIRNYFAQRGKFLRGLPSYEQIEGQHPEDHEQYFDFTYGFPRPLKEAHPVNNFKEDSYQRAQNHSKILLKSFFNDSNNNIRSPRRDYMLTGGTKPVRITSEISGKSRRVFAKLPSVERIIGLSLYNLICNHDPVDFLFSEYIFVEDFVKGDHLDRHNIRYHQSMERLSEEVVRLSIQDKFLGITDLDRSIDLIDRPEMLANIIIQPDGNCVAFDVDCIFMKPFPDYNLPDLFRDRGIEIPENLERRVIKEESASIAHKIHGKSRRAYENFIGLIDKIPMLSSQFRAMGFKSAREYFREKERWLLSQR